jgi:hypothetical protein
MDGSAESLRTLGSARAGCGKLVSGMALTSFLLLIARGFAPP